MNPRPNMEPMCFLHAYFRLGFRNVAGSEQPTANLASKTSGDSRDKNSPISEIPAPPYRNASEKGQSGDVSFPQLLQKYRLIYYPSIRQRERSYFRHLKSSMSEIIEESHHPSACLHTASTCCQIQLPPIFKHCRANVECKDNTFCVKSQDFGDF